MLPQFAFISKATKKKGEKFEKISYYREYALINKEHSFTMEKIGGSKCKSRPFFREIQYTFSILLCLVTERKKLILIRNLWRESCFWLQSVMLAQHRAAGMMKQEVRRQLDKNLFCIPFMNEWEMLYIFENSHHEQKWILREEKTMIMMIMMLMWWRKICST